VLISRRRDHLLLVTHPEHARVAGDLAAVWGNERFAAPARAAAFAYVAAHHDDGWAELDGRPAYAATARRPAHFLEVDLPQTIEPYRRGVDAIHAHDPYAGALASMHWGGLYSSRWGLQPGPPVGHPAAAAVVAEQQRRWPVALQDAWGGDGPRSALEADAWHGYEVLQALDLISLALCTIDLDQPPDPDAAPIAVNDTLRAIDQPSAPRTVPAVPTRTPAERADLTLTVHEPGLVVLAPWPFAVDAVAVAIWARVMEDRPYDSPGAAAAAYAAAPRQALAALISPSAG
jgi:hypothetical protein